MNLSLNPHPKNLYTSRATWRSHECNPINPKLLQEPQTLRSKLEGKVITSTSRFSNPKPNHVDEKIRLNLWNYQTGKRQSLRGGEPLQQWLLKFLPQRKQSNQHWSFHMLEKRGAAKQSQSIPQTKATLRWRKSSHEVKAKEKPNQVYVHHIVQILISFYKD